MTAVIAAGGGVPLPSTSGGGTATVATLPQLPGRPMPSIIDSLVNQLVPIRTAATTLTPGQQSGVIEAVVLSNSPLLNTGDAEPKIRVTLGANQQSLEITTRVPLPVGARVQLQVAPDNLAVLLSIADPKSRPGPPAAQTLAADASTRLNTLAAAIGGNRPVPAINPASAELAAGLAADQTTPRRLLIEQTVRQVLPQQQPLRALLPPLMAVLEHAPSLPAPLVTALSRLAQQFPTAEQLQQPQPVKQALRDSGIFLESKLAREHNTAPGSGRERADATPAPGAHTTRQPLAGDVKALIERVLPQIRALTGEPAGAPATATPASQPNTYTASGEFVLPGQVPGIAANPPPEVNRARAPDNNLDVLLRQLGRQLLASLARTQLHQLDSMGHRQAVSNDPQAPVNHWALEIPILHGNHVDNLELRIEQYQQEAAANAARTTSQWTVMLNFDLHRAGKMQVQLTIVDRAVSATIWSQLRATHLEVQRHVRDLRAGLEQVGVVVRNVECQIGQAPDDRRGLFRQLVDVHT